MPREDAITRGRRLVSEGRLIVSQVSGKSVAGVIRGESGRIWRVGHDPGRGWHCECPAHTKCAHLSALMLVVLEPTIGGEL